MALIMDGVPVHVASYKCHHMACVLLHATTYISKTDQQCNWINPLNPSGRKTGHKRLSNVSAGPKTGHTTFEYNTGG